MGLTAYAGVHLGPPEHIRSDSGSEFMPEPFRMARADRYERALLRTGEPMNRILRRLHSKSGMDC